MAIGRGGQAITLKVRSGPQWVHEIKHDGYRLQDRRDGDRVHLFTRRGFNWADRYPRIVAAARALKASSAVIDGEAVWCGPDGKSDFDKLHSRAHDAQVFLYAFDLLGLNGEDWRGHTTCSTHALTNGKLGHSGIVLVAAWTARNCKSGPHTMASGAAATIAAACSASSSLRTPKPPGITAKLLPSTKPLRLNSSKKASIAGAFRRVGVQKTESIFCRPFRITGECLEGQSILPPFSKWNGAKSGVL